MENIAERKERKQLIKLETYKYNNKSVGINGESKIVKIDKEWLLEAIKPVSLEEFLDSYTWDDSDHLYREYKWKEGMK